MSSRYQMHIVSHTHWDREWYLTFQQYRLRLVDLVDHLLEILDKDKDYKFFTLDGQTVVLDDYFEIKPQNKKRLQEYVKKGRVFVGPWYILPDEFLVSGEATVRNLMLGHRKAEDMGACMKIGYIPDPFGHISQMPQILRGFDIDNFIFTRGMGKLHQLEFWWEGPDGSKVLAIHQKDNYCHGCMLPDDPKEAVNRFDQMFNSIAPVSGSGQVLINNGCDHLEPQPTLPTILENVRKNWKKAELIHSNFPNFIHSVRQSKIKLETVKGELRDCSMHLLLYGVYSARMYLKQKNERAQTTLERYAEPLSSLAWLEGANYPTEQLWHSWTWLIKNHPHDSICGCSIDPVHEQMLARFAWSQEIADEMTNRAVYHIGEKVDTSTLDTTDVGLVLFNPLNWERNEIVQTYIDVPKEARTKGIRVFDLEGKEVPAQISSVKEDMQTILHGQRIPHFEPCNRVRLSFMAENIPSCGYKTFKVTPYQIEKSSTGKKIAHGNILENELIKLTLNGNGSFDLYDKKNKRTYRDCHTLEDGADGGDEYNYSPAANDWIIYSDDNSPAMEIVENGPLLATVKISGVLTIPKGLLADHKSRSEEMVDCPYITYITVKSGSARVDIVTEFENKAEDHRLRVLFPSEVKTDYSYAEGQFDVLKRAIRVPDSKEYKIEVPPSTHPQQTFMDVTDGKSGLAVINQGLPEYEVMDDTDRTIALTLLRCVGWLSRADLLTRCDNAGPSFAAPGAQCPGKHVFKYALLPHKGNYVDGKVHRESHAFNVEFKTYQTKKHEGKMPIEQSFLKVSPDGLLVTALKKSDKDNSLILRAYNITDTKVTGKIEFYRSIRSAHITNLNEETREKIKLKNLKTIQVIVVPKQIITLSIQLA